MNQDTYITFPDLSSDADGLQNIESYQAWVNSQSDAAEQAFEDLIMNSESQDFVDVQSLIKADVLEQAEDTNNSLQEQEAA